MKTWLTPILYLTILCLMYYYRIEIFNWLEQDTSLLPVLALSTLFAVFPIVPYKAVIAVLGYVYGGTGGAAAAWFGTTAAAVIVYAAASLYKEPGRRLLARYRILDSFSKKAERHPFITILLARMIPVIPQMGINIYAGVTSMPFWLYFAATGLGKIPSLFLYAYLGSAFAGKFL
ncbi:VTT domain-containing protein [Paenibacillus lemnae]|uniref:TVP38/TMEM64 family membrane protein n=1 Tax=Paenibacillus lemnae TaxID=1330551 RepID=A0A848M384_PAELE|nr:VTT domain-containing protein [Paenibacillus lemnae]NMO94572.1 TVP38/TMEM64 family protein [Paenibacillus lemnae]